MGSIHGKNKRSKILCSCPFKGTVSPDYECMKAISIKSVDEDRLFQICKKFLTLPLIIYGLS
jgi:hypothetical protein